MSAYCLLRLYKNTKFYSYQNYCIDGISGFLRDGLSENDYLEFDNLQYFKPLSINKEIKIVCAQNNIFDLHKYNYAEIQLFDDSTPPHYSNRLYYFVDKIEWISTNAVKLFLRMDTLNTFLDDLEFSNRTYIEREHINRFDSSTAEISNHVIQRMMRNIPKRNEGFNPLKFNYVLSTAIVDNPLLSKDIIDDTPITAYDTDRMIDSKGISLHPDNDETDANHMNYVLVYQSDNANGVVKPYFAVRTNTTAYDYYVRKSDNNVVKATAFREIPFNYESTIKVCVYPYPPTTSLLNIKRHTINYPIEDNGNDIGIGTWKERVDGTDIDIMTAPYIKRYFAYNSLSDLHRQKHPTIATDYVNKIMLRLLLLQFNKDCTSLINGGVDNTPNGFFKSNGYSNESALYTSEFFTINFFYDSFDYNIALENFTIKPNQYVNMLSSLAPILTIRFAISFLYDNSFAFEFNINSKYWHYKNESPMSEIGIMYCTMNNQLPLISSNYINYMRNGYNYDIKIRDINRQMREAQQTQNAITGGLSAINPVSALVMGKGMANYLTRMSFSGIQEDLTRAKEDIEMERNLAQLKASKIGIDNTNGATERTIETNQSGKLAMCIKAPSQEIIDEMDRFFYFYGSLVKEYKIPTHNNRRHFDYLKCKAEFVNRNAIPSTEILEDIIARLNNGITYIHRVNSGGIDKWIFDFDNKENIENDLYEIL